MLAWQRMAQVLDQVAKHLVSTRRVGACQHLGIGQGVVEEMRLDLGLQQVQPGHGQGVVGGAAFGLGLLVAALLGHPAADRALQRLGVLVAGAFVQREQVHPVRRVRFAQHGRAAGAFTGQHRGQHPVAGDGKARQQVPARGLGATERIAAAHLGPHLQAAARSLDVLHPRQFAHRRLDQVERGAGIERQFDPALLVVAQHRRIQSAGGQAHPAQVGDRADQGQRDRTPGQQPEQGLGPAEQDRPDDAGQQDRDRPGEQDAQDEEKAGGHVDIHGLGCRGA